MNLLRHLVGLPGGGISPT